MFPTEHTHDRTNDTWHRPSSPSPTVSGRSASPADDSVERALHSIRLVADEALEGYRQRVPSHAPEFTAPPPEHALGRFLAEAGPEPLREIWSSPPGGGNVHTRLVYWRIRTATTDGEILYTEYAALSLLTGGANLPYSGGQRVTMCGVPVSLLLGQGVGLVLRTDRSGLQRPLLIRDRGLLESLVLLHQLLWTNAVDLALFQERGDAVRDDVRRQVVRFLSLGLKDEVAARKLDVSVRTYRRYVADLLRELGAASRFQAGYQAARRGLVAGDVNGRGG